jgi:hypothetical protein
MALKLRRELGDYSSWNLERWKGPHLMTKDPNLMCLTSSHSKPSVPRDRCVFISNKTDRIISFINLLKSKITIFEVLALKESSPVNSTFRTSFHLSYFVTHIISLIVCTFFLFNLLSLYKSITKYFRTKKYKFQK